MNIHYVQNFSARLLTKFGQFTSINNIFVKLVIIGNWKDHLIYPFQLTNIMVSDITKFYFGSEKKK